MHKGFSTVTEQVAQVLREGLHSGRWQGVVPGRNHLAAELGVNHKTVKAALTILEREGLLEAHGPGKKRSILLDVPTAPVARRVMIFSYEKGDLQMDDLVNIIHRLQSAGHWAGFASKTLCELGMDVNRIARFVAKSDADAWIVVAGGSEVLNWFSAQPFPAFALFGRSRDISIAGAVPEKLNAFNELIDRLVELGHRRIVMVAREEKRKPKIGGLEMKFLERLESHGIKTGSYNLPDWGNDPDSLGQSMDSLFRHTPPTAVIADDAQLFPALIQHLARLGLSAPKHVSLASMDYISGFDWYRPTVTHIAWNHDTVLNRVVSWANQMSQGKDDRRKLSIQAKLIIGGTIGPAPQG
jgi:DNA-binding LacI/PurR family transcriptional regulator